MSVFSFARVSRVLIASAIGTAILIPLLREPPEAEEPSAALDTGSTDAAPDPGRANLRLRIAVAGRYGFADGNGHVVIAPTFAMAMPFSEGLAAVGECSNGGKLTTWRFIDDHGNVSITRTFDGVRIGTFHEGLAPLFAGKKAGFVDTSGQVIVQPVFDEVDDFHEDLAAVRVGEKWGVIDRHGEMKLPPTYDGIGTFSGGHASVAIGKRCGYIDSACKLTIPPQWDRVADFSEGLAAVYTDTADHSNVLTSYIDLAGNTVIPQLSADGGAFHEGVAAARSPAGSYYMDTTGKAVISLPGVQDVGRFSNGLAYVLIGGQYGFINHAGATAIAPQWSFVDSFQNGVAKVGTNSVHGYINTAGQYVWKLAVH